VLPEKVTCTPENLCKEVFSQHERLEQLLHKEMLSLSQGVLIISKSWSLDLGLQENQEVICDGLLISQDRVPVLYTFVGVDEGSFLNESGCKLKSYSNLTARTLKQKLVKLGGYTGEVGILTKIYCVSPEAILLYDSSLELPYPENYCLKTQTVTDLLKALFIALNSPKSLNLLALSFSMSIISRVCSLFSRLFSFLKIFFSSLF
jgi:hypothetical protein